MLYSYLTKENNQILKFGMFIDLMQNILYCIWKSIENNQNINKNIILDLI